MMLGSPWTGALSGGIVGLVLGLIPGEIRSQQKKDVE
jgi:hypothetical protein